jgi:hypothetical protein
MLPWVTVRDLVSKILSLAANRLHEDWERVYGYRPLLQSCLLPGPNTDWDEAAGSTHRLFADHRHFFLDFAELLHGNLAG